MLLGVQSSMKRSVAYVVALQFGDWLQNGFVLCELANTIQPGKIRVNKSNAPWLQMENVRGAADVGLRWITCIVNL